MRVLIAHNRYRVAGGEERHVELLVHGLTAAGVDVRRFERESAEIDDSVLRKSAAALALTYRPRAGGLGTLIDNWCPTVVHFHNTWPLLTPSAMRAAKRSGAVVVLTAHNYRFACPGGTLLRNGAIHEDCIDGSSLRCGLRNSRGRRAESLAYGIALEIQRRLGMLRRWVDAFVAPSEFMANMLVRSGLPHDRVHVVNYGVPLRDVSFGDRRHGLFVGRLVAEKGVHTLLSASRLSPEVPMVLAGAGPLASQAQAFGGSTSYAGRLDDDGVTEALSQAAFTIAPSEWYENLPFAALESFAAGRPVIATRIGGLSEIVEDGVTGLLIPPRDPSALAAAMTQLWRDHQKAAEMGRQARAVAEERFSLEHQTARLISLYAGLVV